MRITFSLGQKCFFFLLFRKHSNTKGLFIYHHKCQIAVLKIKKVKQQMFDALLIERIN